MQGSAGMSDYQDQTPRMPLEDVANILWNAGEHVAYRALQAWIKERANMLNRLKDLERENHFAR
jgi:hypothetical protein